MIPEPCPDRVVTALTGTDALTFLQGLVSNDLRPLTGADGLIWTGLLTPQGKYLADFFVGRLGGQLFLDLPVAIAAPTLARLSLYKLRADVHFAPLDWPVGRGLGQGPAQSLPDPRHPALGWRSYDLPTGTSLTDWTALRVTHVIPETGTELIAQDSYLLECGFERLHGVDFRKGCYVGQEVTARMKHKTELRKGLVQVRISGTAPVGTPITAMGKDVGSLFTQSGGRAIAYLRFDRAAGVMQADGATVEWDGAEV